MNIQLEATRVYGSRGQSQLALRRSQADQHYSRSNCRDRRGHPRTSGHNTAATGRSELKVDAVRWARAGAEAPGRSGALPAEPYRSIPSRSVFGALKSIRGEGLLLRRQLEYPVTR